MLNALWVIYFAENVIPTSILRIPVIVNEAVLANGDSVEAGVESSHPDVDADSIAVASIRVAFLIAHFRECDKSSFFPGTTLTSFAPWILCKVYLGVTFISCVCPPCAGGILENRLRYRRST